MKSILFLLLDFSKESNNNGLYKELVNEFRDRGQNVYVATLNERRNNEETKLSVENGVNVLRIKTGNLFNVSFVEKGISTLLLGVNFKNAIKKYFSDVKFHLVIHVTPPITFTNVIEYIEERDGAKSYLILRDIFPQNAKDLGIIKSELLFNFFRRKEEKLYEKSDKIGCMSQGNIEYIKKHNSEVENSKLHILSNWGKIKDVPSINKEEIRSRYSFKKDDFIVVFGGNMGRPQGLDFLLELANKTKDIEDIKYLFVGKGNEKSKLLKIKEEKKLENVVFLDFVPRDDYENLTASCDVGIVSLHSSFTIPNIPSKTVDYCKLALPILAVTDENTDYGDIITKEAKCGAHSIYGDLESYYLNLMKLYKDRELCKELGSNGRKYYEEYLGVDKAYLTIMNNMEENGNV